MFGKDGGGGGGGGWCVQRQWERRKGRSVAMTVGTLWMSWRRTCWELVWQKRMKGIGQMKRSSPKKNKTLFIVLLYHKWLLITDNSFLWSYIKPNCSQIVWRTSEVFALQYIQSLYLICAAARHTTLKSNEAFSHKNGAVPSSSWYSQVAWTATDLSI